MTNATIKNGFNFIFILAVDLDRRWRFLKSTSDGISNDRFEQRDMEDGVYFHGRREFEAVRPGSNLIKDLKWTEFNIIEFTARTQSLNITTKEPNMVTNREFRVRKMLTVVEF